ncbi:RHS repeat domain-containing protein [Stenotrophomonas sp. PD6]|uniref:RHS repeat protein n=1 Tax=Stenotrophomonas sp. PD6 TaxID=3368612 RepID=UPI003BA1F3B3
MEDRGLGRGTRGMAALTVLLSLSAFAAKAQSDANFSWDELDRRLPSSLKVEALGPTLMGDEISLADGGLGFSVIDVSLPGNDALPVELKRSYSVKDRKDTINDGMLADWQIDAPSISGVFAPDWVNTGDQPGNRCSAATLPPVPLRHERSDFWQGLTINVPGGGEMLRRAQAAPAPSNGTSYPWNTSGQIQIACLDAIRNGTGEGFIALTPDGTKYRFDWMAQNSDRRVRQIVGYSPNTGSPYSTYLDRRYNALYATRVEDRFGNAVEYTYANAWNQPARLTRIASSDGRALNITYTGNFVSSVSDGARSWQYTVDGTYKTLTRVQLPDGSAWNLQFREFATARIEHPVPQYETPPLNADCFPVGSVVLPTEIFRTCSEQILAPSIGSVGNPLDSLTGTVVHPSGAIGTFTVDLRPHGRSHVPLTCSNVTTVGSNPPYWGYGNDPTDDVPIYPIFAYTLTLRNKTVAGEGMTAASWTYDYVPNFGFDRYPGTSEEYPVCPYNTSTQCQQPLCTSESCAQSSVTTVQEPDGRWRRFYYGNTYRYNEGKLLREEVGSGGSVLRSTSYTYDLSGADSAYPARYGTSLKLNGDGFQSEFHRPQIQRVILQDGVEYARANTALDVFSRPTAISRSNSIGFLRNESLGYFDQLSLWVLGQVNRSACTGPAACAGEVMFSVDYDPVRAVPMKTYRFGAVDQILNYHPDGTVASVADARSLGGLDTVVHLSNWKRGYPQLMAYPGGQSKQAVVNDQGWITSETDENGFATGYAYDPMGRLSEVTYPTGDATVWSNRSLAFRPLTSADPRPPGIAAGQWRELVVQGNYRKATYFDAMWRPVLVHEYDQASQATTLSAVSHEYDASGRTIFNSYPSRDAVPAALGEWVFHDALDRVTESRSDSELGQLISRYEYLPGNQIRQTNPKGAVTLTAYDAFDEPKYELPASMDMPGGIHMAIDRDIYGKPLSINRVGTGQ